MKRSELSDAGKARISRLVGDLYFGRSICIPKSEMGHPVYITFRLEGEELPELPLDPPEKSFGANQSSVYTTGATYDGIPGNGGTVTGYRWMGSGSLDEILITLERFGDVEKLLEAYAIQASFNRMVNTDFAKSFLQLHTGGLTDSDPQAEKSSIDRERG